MTPFSQGDRALCLDVYQTPLTRGRLYYVERVIMLPTGRQIIKVLGHFIPIAADKFQRVPNPAPRAWPLSP